MPWKPLAVALIVLVAAAAARADEPCPAATTTGRREADKEVKAGKAAAALARLDALKTRCFDKLDAAARLWLLSDMAFAAHTAGDDERCAKLILEVDDDAATQNPKPAKALLYNAGLCKPREGCDYKLDGDEPVCKMKLAVEYADRNGLTGFAAPACDLPKHADAVKLPDGSCLERTKARRKGEDDIVCGSFYVVDAKGKRRKVAFGKVGGIWLDSPSDCCNVRDVQVKGEGGKTFVLIGSRELSRDCFGGTATTDYLTLFTLSGATLEPERDFSISWH